MQLIPMLQTANALVALTSLMAGLIALKRHLRRI